jgi:hypothetical protein
MFVAVKEKAFWKIYIFQKILINSLAAFQGSVLKCPYWLKTMLESHCCCFKTVLESYC